MRKHLIVQIGRAAKRYPGFRSVTDGVGRNDDRTRSAEMSAVWRVNCSAHGSAPENGLHLRSSATQEDAVDDEHLAGRGRHLALKRGEFAVKPFAGLVGAPSGKILAIDTIVQTRPLCRRSRSPDTACPSLDFSSCPELF